MILSKDKYIETVRRAYPPLWSSSIMMGAMREDVHKAFFTKPYARKHTVICDYVWWYPIATEEKAKQLIGREWTSAARLKRIIHIFAEREKKLLAVAKKKNLSDIFSAYEEYMPALNLGYLAEFPFLARLKRVLLQKVSQKEAEHILEELNVPLKDNFYKKEEYELVKGERLKTHIRKYEWILSRYGSDTPYTQREAEKKRAHISRTEFLDKYREEKKKVRLIVSRAKKVVGPKYAFLVDALQFVIFFRTHRTDIMNKISYLCIPQLKNIARDNNISYEEILFSTKDELLAMKIPPRSVLKERMKGHAMVILEDGVHCFTGEPYRKVKAAFKEHIEEMVEMHGIVASRGLVSGHVKVVMGRPDFARVINGDILVTSMTTPEMLPFMKKAGAIITDEGGITCHAAIVARELKIPCIISTKIATKVLKDGDLVEVDANQGIVKIIKR